MELNMIDDSMETKSMENGFAGVWVKGGKVYVKNPVSDGVSVLTITPCTGVDLYINGNQITGRTIVKEKDEIVLKPSVIEEPGSFQLVVAPDGLSVTLQVKTGTTTRYIVEDAGPETDLVLRSVSRVEDTCPFTLVQILQELSRKNVTFGIKHSEIQAIYAKPASGSYLIAEGEAPGETTNDRIDLKFPTGPEGQKADNIGDKVDFRDIGEITSVDAGNLLAERHPGVQGKSGRKVNGALIIPPKPVVHELGAGKGVEVSPDGNKAVALISGRPIVKKLGNRCMIDVDPVLHKKGDIDISTGNIRFKGDVVVHGNVCEGMTLQAAGKIHIMGMIFSAQIAAQGDITAVQNITGGNLVAGGNNSFFKAFNKLLESLYNDFFELTQVVSGMAEQASKKNIKTGQLVQLLIDKKYGRIPGFINEIIKLTGNNTFILSREMVDLVGLLEKKLSGLNILKIESYDELEKVLLEIKEGRRIIENMAKNKANITFSYAVNSRIESSGDVKVEGGGCINTTINAGGNVSIKGVFRGGEINATGDIILNEAGSEMGARTLIKTESGRKVYIRKAFEGVRVQVGDRLASVTSTQTNIKAELDEAGVLMIYHAGK
ncbi:MAG: DUF342 domain-containing protein [Peptococcaceae bacterium]|nr:DUF342 domain-containing protein [Peptococcaceae bacterium]